MIYQFEQLERCKPRNEAQRDMVLYLPDEIYIVNHRKEEAFVRRYDFQYQADQLNLYPEKENIHHINLFINLKKAVIMNQASTLKWSRKPKKIFLW